ncbi:MAG: hypothetical protein FIB02_02170 [Desulfuromonas sp.]|nr:hypothetical protein [Desulfuromonas sp.]
MRKSLAAILGMIALIAFPVVTLAKSQKGGHGGGNEPAPNTSAYEHAGEKASFQRDSHDMGKHQGQEEQKAAGDKDKDKEKGISDDKGKDKDKEKGKEEQGKQKEADQKTVKDKDKEATDKSDKEKGGKDKDLELEKEKGKQKDGGSSADKLLDQVKQKGGKAK